MMARKPPSDPDTILNEPQYRQTVLPSTPSEAPLDSVWMEPSHQATGLTRGLHPYADWIQAELARHSVAGAWIRTFLLALFAGPLAVASVFLTRHPGAGMLMVVVAGPLIEEVGKILLPLMVMERNPARFTSSAQLIFCGLCSGLVFAAIENLIYLHVYFPETSAALIRWRWTICVALHSGCSLLAGMGVARIWQEAQLRYTPPKLERGAPLIFTAVVIHGLYNLVAVFLNSWFE